MSSSKKSRFKNNIRSSRSRRSVEKKSKHVSRSYPVGKKRTRKVAGYIARSRRKNEKIDRVDKNDKTCKTKNNKNEMKKYKEITARRSRNIVTISDSKNKTLSYIRKL